MRYTALLLAILLAASASAESPTYLVSDIDTLIEAALEGDEIALDDEARAVLEAEAPQGLALAWLRLRHALAINPDTRAETGLRLASARLLEAQQRFEEGDMTRAQRALQNYASIQENIRTSLQARERSAEEHELRRQATYEARLELQESLASRLEGNVLIDRRIDETAREVLQRELQAAHERAQEARDAASENRERIASSLRERGVLDDEERIRIEARLDIVGSERSEEAVTRALIAAAANRVSAAERLLRENWEGNEDSLRPARLHIADARTHLLDARESYQDSAYADAQASARRAGSEAGQAHTLIAQTLREPPERDVYFSYNMQTSVVMMYVNRQAHTRLEVRSRTREDIIAEVAAEFGLSEDLVRERMRWQSAQLTTERPESEERPAMRDPPRIDREQARIDSQSR